ARSDDKNKKPTPPPKAPPAVKQAPPADQGHQGGGGSTGGGRPHQGRGPRAQRERAATAGGGRKAHRCGANATSSRPRPPKDPAKAAGKDEDQLDNDGRWRSRKAAEDRHAAAGQNA